MPPKVLISRKVFDEVIDIVKRHFEVEDNQIDIPFSSEELIRTLQGKAGQSSSSRTELTRPSFLNAQTSK